jgi:hypothetical protein
MNWEEIDEYHWRAKVRGGWVLKCVEDVMQNVDGMLKAGWDWRSSICFIPDPKHEWEIGDL